MSAQVAPEGSIQRLVQSLDCVELGAPKTVTLPSGVLEVNPPHTTGVKLSPLVPTWVRTDAPAMLEHVLLAGGAVSPSSSRLMGASKSTTDVNTAKDEAIDTLSGRR